YHSALGYFRIDLRIMSTFSQLSRHSCAYRFFVAMSTMSISYPHRCVYFRLFSILLRSIAHSRAPFKSITPPPTLAPSITTTLLPLPIDDLRYAWAIATL